VILGLETSCDETASALVTHDGEIRANVVASQADLHARYGGVVPEIASRRHLELVMPVVDEALAEAGATLDDVDTVAVTTGPGLIGALLVGLSAAKALAWARGLPLVPVDHLHGHVAALYLRPQEVEPPFLCLLASGGHTLLLDVQDHSGFTTLGTTLDDAAGEAFDKGARLLGLGYPGGPLVDALAVRGDAAAVPLPRPMEGERDMSFSGLKTAVRSRLERHPGTRPADLAASFQEAVADVLVDRVLRASARTGVTRICIGGGVAANSRVRARIASCGLDAYLPPRARCTDNGAMIANVGRLRLLAGIAPGPASARPRWPVGES
jgi:N6-L-threonylcarbamoyladenine synthase